MIQSGMMSWSVALSKNRSRPLRKNQKISAPATGPNTRAAPPISRTVYTKKVVSVAKSEGATLSVATPLMMPAIAPITPPRMSACIL